MFARFCQASIMLIIAFSAVLSTSHAAKIYHWIDEDGRSHYSEKPPREVQAETLNIRPAGTGTPPSSYSSKDSTAKKEVATEASEKEGLTVEYSPEEKAQYCQQSRILMQRMNGNTQRRFEQPDGSYRRLEQAEIADYKAQAQTGIENYCK